MTVTRVVYVLELTYDEHQSLCWVADRYCSAAVLIDTGNWTELDEDDQEIDEIDVKPTVMRGVFTAGAMWGYIASLHALEDYDFPPPPFPPCVGGDLATKLRDLVVSFPTDMEFR